MLLPAIKQFNRKVRRTAIHHKSLVPRYTHMEADTIHVATEKIKKLATAKIDISRHWANFIPLILANHLLMFMKCDKNSSLILNICYLESFNT